MQSGVAESFRIRFGPQLSRTDYLAHMVNRQCVSKGNPFGRQQSRSRWAADAFKEWEPGLPHSAGSWAPTLDIPGSAICVKQTHSAGSVVSILIPIPVMLLHANGITGKVTRRRRRATASDEEHSLKRGTERFARGSDLQRLVVERELRS